MSGALLTKTTRVAFACRCGKEAERAEKDRKYAEIRAFVLDKIAEHYSVEPSWLTAVLWSFAGFGAGLESVYTDIWSVVYVEVDRGGENAEMISCQCDRVEDGLFAIWHFLYERNGGWSG